jgi:hypothetical protein
VSPAVELALRSVLIGVGATLTMDVWAAVLRHLGIPSLRLPLLGRFVGHLPRGHFRHDDIARSPAVAGERLIGWCAHYAIGIGFAGLLLATYGLRWAHAPTLGPALLVGVVTVLAPWLLLQPAFGAGIASSKTPRPLFNALKSLVTHFVYGVGLFLAAHLTEHVL